MVSTIKRNVENIENGLLKVIFVTDDNVGLFNVSNHELVINIDNKFVDYLVDKFNKKYTREEIVLILGTVKFKFARSLKIENDGSIIISSTKKHLRQITMDIIDWIKRGVRYLKLLEKDKIDRDNDWLQQISISIENTMKSADKIIVKSNRK